MSEQTRPAQEVEDFEWALERTERMCASALVDARVYRTKLLKGFGYPNETFSRAQDHRALLIVLNRLSALIAERDALRVALRELVEQWRAMQHSTYDPDFYEWCDYDMEIEASKVVFKQCANKLSAILTPE